MGRLPLAEVTLTFNTGSVLDSRATRGGEILLGAFLLSFLFIRTSARLMRSPRVPWWPGSVTTEGGLHVHHLVFGIFLLLLCGFLLALEPASPWYEIVAALFGIGAGLTLDEYALWVHLDDVYWAEEGRRSVDAVVIAALIGGMILMGFAPVGSGAGVVTIVVTVVVALALCTVAVLKGKVMLGITGMFLPLLALVAAVRLAKPDSPWARRRYPPESRKRIRAARRNERHVRRYQRFQDRIAGAPGGPPSGPDA
jgi:hypothetical protein